MSLETLREEVDDLDRQVAALLQKRAAAVLKIGEFKAGNDKAVFDPGREEHVYKNAIEAARGPMPELSMRSDSSSAARDSRR